MTTSHRGSVSRGLLTLALLAAAGDTAAAQPADRSPLVLVGDKDYAPLSYLVDGAPRGLDVDVAVAIGRVLDRPVRVVLMEWSDAQRNVLEGRADAVLSMGISDERRAQFTFTEPTLVHEYGLFVRTGDEQAPRRVGVTPGGFPRRFFATRPEVEQVSIRNYDDGFDQLTARAVDAVAADTWVAAHTIEQRRLRSVTLIQPPFATLPAAIAVRRDRLDTADAINGAIRTLRAQGALRKIQDRWRPQEMLFASRGRVHGYIAIAVGSCLLVLLGATAVWVVTLKREIRVRKASEAARQSTEARVTLLAHALHAANDCIAITDATDHILYANAAFLRTYEYDVDDVIGRHISLLRPEAHRGGVDGPPTSFEWEAWRGELWNRTRSGRVFPVSLTASIVRDDHGRRIAAVGVARDVTKEKQAEADLRASETRYRELVENANDAVFTVDRDGYCQSMNRAGRTMSGCDVEDPRGVPVEQLLDAEQAALARGQLHRVLEGENVPPFELTIVHKTGARLTVELALRAVAGDGRPTAAQGITRDVTLRKELEMQVIQSQKMQAIGQLAAGVAHDFNNLMTVVLGNCHEALAIAGDAHAAHGPIEEIRLAAERAASLTSQLLAFSRRQMMQPRVLRLDGVIAETERMLTRLIGEHIELFVERDADLGLVSLDPGQLQQILLNLTVNARDAMANGGRLTIETRNVRLDLGAVQHRRHVPPGDYVMLAVSDNGAGMDGATRARLFEPFFTTKAVGKGTGLGLSTVHGIVEQSDGFISVYSEPGVGTTFKIYFPRVHDRPASTAPSATGDGSGTTAASARGDGEVVLLVEDERAVRDLVSRYLKAQRYTVVTAASGDEALSLCGSLETAPALVITDVVMPGMSGPTLVETLSRSWPNLQVLYLSGYTDAAILRNGILPAGTHFQQKPFALDALIRKVRDILDATAEPRDRAS
jgi:two-component system cell cycle sensor histidine kinase/response regulator CckA